MENKEFKPLRKIVADNPQLFLGVNLKDTKQTTMGGLNNPLLESALENAQVGDITLKNTLQCVQAISDSLNALFLHACVKSRRADIHLTLYQADKQ